MSWFPSFLNLWPAALAAAISIPLLLVLYFLKLRRREMPVSSTFLWKKAIQDLQVNAPFQKLRRNLLLLLQLLLLALLVLALARPVSNYTKGAGKITVILVDRSASMAALDTFAGDKHTRLEEAKKQAKSLVDSMTRGDTAMVIGFDESADIVSPFTTDAQRLRQAIDAIQQTDRKSRLKTAYKLAEAQTAYFPEQLRPGDKPTVFLYSDGRVLDANELSLRADLNFEKIGTDACQNIAIVALDAKRNYERPTEVQVFARLVNYGPEPVSGVDVVLTVDGQTRGTANDLVLLPERWTEAQRQKAESEHLIARDSVDFPSIELLNSAVIKLDQMHKEGDVLSCDDSAVVVVPPPKSMTVLLVTDGNYFLEKALDSMPTIKKPETVSPVKYEEAAMAAYDVILFDRYTPKRLPDAGNFIYFGCIAPGLKLKAEQDHGKNVIIKDGLTVLDWKRDHPILRGLQLGKLYAAEGLKLDTPREAEVLVDGYKGPLVVLDREGRRTHLVVSFDVLQSNWPLKISFPVFINNALQFLALGSDMDVRQAYEPGATPRIPRTDLQKMVPMPTQIRLDGPMGRKTVKVPETGDFVLPALDKVGLYVTDPPVPGFERIAVNLLDENESNLVTADRKPGDPTGLPEVAGGKTRLELWWWIVACLALPLLLIEWWVYTRRVHM